MEPHPHDMKWIKEQLEKLTADKRKYAINRYQDTFAFYFSEGGISAEANARREANIELLNYVEQNKK